MGVGGGVAGKLQSGQKFHLFSLSKRERKRESNCVTIVLEQN